MRSPSLAYSSLILGFLGFGMVALFGDYWSEHRFLAGAVLIGLAALSLYTNRLIVRLTKAVEWAETAAVIEQRFRPMSHGMYSAPNGVDATPSVKEPASQLDEAKVLLLGFGAAELSAVETSLASWGAKTTVASDTADAFAAISAMLQAGNSFDAVLVHDSGVINDMQTIPAQFINHVSSRLAPLICCLHNYDSVTRGKLLAAGFHAVLPLPVDKRLLFSALHTTTVNHGHKSGIVSLADYYANKEMAKSTLRILVAEDNPTNQKIIAKTLEHAGHQVKIVEDGEFAINELENADYDILILDMHMPNMGGLDVMKALRFVQSKDEKIPIIVCSAEATASEIAECESLGAGAFLPKPVQANRLLDTIAQLVDKRSAIPADQPDNATDSEEAGRQVINLSMLSELETLSADPAFLSALIQGFIADNRTLVQQMETALKSSDAEQFKDFVHAMKGSAASIGAERLSDLCSLLAAMDHKKLITDAAKILNQVTETLAPTCAALSEYLKARQSAVS